MKVWLRRRKRIKVQGRLKRPKDHREENGRWKLEALEIEQSHAENDELFDWLGVLGLLTDVERNCLQKSF